MSTSPRLPVGRLAAEFVVIVTGVLVALGGQAWYEAREETEREIDALRAIRVDLMRIEEEVSELRGREEANLAGVLETRDIIRGARPRPQPWEPAVGLGFQQLRLPLGSLDALVASGETRLIRSSGLRGELIAYRDRQLGREAYVRQFDASTIERTAQFIDGLEGLLITSGIDAGPDMGGPPLQLLPPDVLRGSSEILGYLTFSATMASARVGNFGSVVRDATRIREAIEAEFTARGIPFEPAPGPPVSEPPPNESD